MREAKVDQLLAGTASDTEPRTPGASTLALDVHSASHAQLPSVDLAALATNEAAESGNRFVRRKLGGLFWVSVGWMTLIVVLAVLAPVLPMPEPSRTGFTCPRCGPLDGALLGGDSLGRDIFSRLLSGARVSLVVGFVSIGLGMLVGGFLGIAAGYYRGRLETVIMTLIDALLAFPSLVLLLALVTFIADNDATVLHVTLAIGVLTIAPFCRLARASTLSITHQEYVLAARTIGSTHRRIIRREILPNVIPAALSFALIGVAFAIVAEGGLAFLGLSVGAPTATWGGMINDGRLVLRDAAHVALIPSFAMFLTVLALNYIGDGLSARYGMRDSAL